MIRWLPAAILLACGAAVTEARADSFPALRIGVLKFESADVAASDAAASDIFSTSLYRNFPGLSVVARPELEAVIPAEQLKREGRRVDQAAAALLQRNMGLDSLISGNILALDKDTKGDGGTLMMSARLVKLSSGEILWADTRTVRIRAPFLRTRDSDAVVTGKLLELAVFALVQDLGKRLPKEALVPMGRRGSAGSSDTEVEGCSPPAFYRSLARDRDWYYGVGKNPDTDKARDAALINLAKQVTGNVGTSNDSRIRDIAGPGQGQLEVADKIGNLLPQSNLLAGWEQDDHQRCNGISYVLIRIEKERVNKFIIGNSEFRNALQSSLYATQRKTAEMNQEQRLDFLGAKNKQYLEQLKESPVSENSTSHHDDLINHFVAPLLVESALENMRAYLRSGRVREQVVRANAASMKIIFSDLLSQDKHCGAKDCMGGPTRKETDSIAEAHHKITAGTITMENVIRVRAIYQNYWEDEEARDFLDAVIYREGPLSGPLARNYKLPHELAFPLAWSVAMTLNDWPRYFKYCGDYLRKYPGGIYAVEAEKNREDAAKILMLRNKELVAGLGTDES